jgi:hypothetical protein
MPWKTGVSRSWSRLPVRVLVALLACLIGVLSASPSSATDTTCVQDGTCVPAISVNGVVMPVNGEPGTEGPELPGAVIDGTHWTYDSGVIAYGYYNGTFDEVGEFKATAKITLNGRQSQWSQTIRPWTGPSLKPTLYWNCVDDNGPLPNGECNEDTGSWPHYGPPATWQPGTFGGILKTNYHRQDETYWYDFYYKWQAEGEGSGSWYWPNTGHFTSAKFVCSASQSPVCKFP